jgi:hypothetical protein
MYGRFIQIQGSLKEPFKNIEERDLVSIQPESQLKQTGTIVGLVIRPDKGLREYVKKVRVGHSHIEGDENQFSTEVTQELEAVSLIRADVSHAMGGFHVTGDNIHVDGIKLGKDTFRSGDLLYVIDSSTRKIKVVLLRTDVPHYACYKFIQRCGQIAHDFVNAEGVYEQGFQKSNETDPATSELIHGTQHNLRGVKLAVLKSGTIALGDQVSIVKGKQVLSYLRKHRLESEYVRLLEMSNAYGTKLKQEQLAKQTIRKRARQRKAD